MLEGEQRMSRQTIENFLDHLSVNTGTTEYFIATQGKVVSALLKIRNFSAFDLVSRSRYVC
jgi:hypothetical protein